MPLLLRVLLLSLIPVVAAAVGGGIAALRPPGDRLRSAVQHFAAGIVFAAAAIELLPPVMAQAPVVAIAGFGVGVAAMLLLRWVSRRAEQGQGKGGVSTGLVATAGVDMAIDGLVTGAGFASGEQTGLLLVTALVLEFVFFGLSIAMALNQNRSRWQTVGVTAGLALGAPVGSVAGFLVLGGVSGAVLAGVLAFGAVALMYLVTEELLTEAHEVAETPWATALFFVGFLSYLLIEEVAAGH